MQRKRTINNKTGDVWISGGASNDDDGGSAKLKNSNKRGSSKNIISSSISSDCLHELCLPDVPVALKLVILSFVGFALLVVLTAKGRHAHWRYKNSWHMRAPHMPQPLLDKLKGSRGSSKGIRSTSNRQSATLGGDNSQSLADASQQMLAQPSKFVDSEKKLKRQLKQLLDKQNAEKKQHKVNPNDSILGVKISTRYLGEDILPYPNSKGNEKQWTKQMEVRKKELALIDDKEYKDMKRQYNEIMEHHIEVNDRVDHALGEDISDEGRIEDNNNKASIIRPPKGSIQWPSPSEKAGSDTTILLKPAFGSHRPDQDAILIFAEGYDLSIYLAFVESLLNTGYTGDLVISISNEAKLKPGVNEYLQSHSNNSQSVNVIAYEVNWSCFKQSGETATGSNEGINHCKMDNAFGDANGNPISDPRAPRPVATARYELYWMWSLQYNKESWLMLIDARDVWFQLHPFKELEDRGKVSGELHLFGENADAVRIGTSNYNRRWLNTAYGEKNVKPFYDKPVICSGSTIGNQDAIETYLRAMVAEYDATLCKQKGCDQGFHNYLYYSGKLEKSLNTEGISKIIVHEQGKGIINNLGAMRTKPLTEWGLYDAKRELVLNWDGTTSRVAHQYDRDKEANNMVKNKKKQFERQWKANKRLR